MKREDKLLLAMTRTEGWVLFKKEVSVRGDVAVRNQKDKIGESLSQASGESIAWAVIKALMESYEKPEKDEEEE